MHDDDDLDHSHVFDLLDNEEAEDIEGIEKFTLYSVGIDIGSSTTHTIFSRLILRREGAGLSARFVVTNRDVLYRSPIMLTPYSSGTAIDTDSVQEFIERSYSDAGFTPDDVDTGAVVITGEALKKENAQPILEYFLGGVGTLHLRVRRPDARGAPRRVRIRRGRHLQDPRQHRSGRGHGRRDDQGLPDPRGRDRTDGRRRGRGPPHRLRRRHDHHARRAACAHHPGLARPDGRGRREAHGGEAGPVRRQR